MTVETTITVENGITDAEAKKQDPAIINEEEEDDAGDPSLEKVKKKRRKKKKKGGAGGPDKGATLEGVTEPPSQTQPPAEKKKGGKTDSGSRQTNPPSIPITELFPNKNYPIGQIMEYPTFNDDRSAKNRYTSEEAKQIESSFEEIYQDFRRAAECHRTTRRWAFFNWRFILTQISKYHRTLVLSITHLRSGFPLSGSVSIDWQKGAKYLSRNREWLEVDLQHNFLFF